MNIELCPFRIGDIVAYMPSSRGVALEANCPAEQKLEVGKHYRVQRITEGLYVTVEGYQHPGGGLYWTEFQTVNAP